jgi:hypothetical protein
VLGYVNESCTVAKKSESALNEFERKILGRIIGPMKEKSP